MDIGLEIISYFGKCNGIFISTDKATSGSVEDMQLRRVLDQGYKQTVTRI